MATTDTLDIGFIGLGVMGAPMAGHLARAGHRLTVLDLDPARTQAVAREIGAAAAATPREVAAASEVVFTMLPDGRVVQHVALGLPDGAGPAGGDALVHGLRRGTLLVDTSSAEPWLTEATAAGLAAVGATMVDAPVSGAAWGAQAAELVFMVGGADADVARALPLLRLMGKACHPLGALGAGHAMKCINNTITSMTLLATAEGLVAGKRYGLDPEAMLDVLNQSTGGSWITQTHFRQRIFNRAFDDPFKLALMLKDIGIALQLARDTATPMPLSGLGQQLWRMADQAAADGASVSELVRWVEQQTGTALTPGRGERQRG